MADESGTDETTRGGAADSERAGEAAATGGTDRSGRGGPAGGRTPEKGGATGVRETGDVSGATSTHAGAAGNFDNNGGTGTAPTEG